MSTNAMKDLTYDSSFKRLVCLSAIDLKHLEAMMPILQNHKVADSKAEWKWKLEVSNKSNTTPSLLRKCEYL